MKINALSMFAVFALVAATSQSLAEERADVLERIAPIGKVTVEGQEKPAPAPVAEVVPAEAPATEAPATEAPAAEAPAAEAPAVETPAAAPVAEAAPAAAADQLALATTSGCMACHQIEMKVVGPSYKEVAAKYKGDAAALDQLAAKVKAGGTGVWGPIPMPPNAHVSDENIRAIVTWILSL